MQKYMGVMIMARKKTKEVKEILVGTEDEYTIDTVMQVKDTEKTESTHETLASTKKEVTSRYRSFKESRKL